MRSNMLKVEIMPPSVIITVVTISFIIVFIGMLFITKGIQELEQIKAYTNLTLENNINQ